jgi:hypothetical protein
MWVIAGNRILKKWDLIRGEGAAGLSQYVAGDCSVCLHAFHHISTCKHILLCESEIYFWVLYKVKFT